LVRPPKQEQKRKGGSAAVALPTLRLPWTTGRGREWCSRVDRVRCARLCKGKRIEEGMWPPPWRDIASLCFERGGEEGRGAPA
jgi:hypothetical protein